jgi:hypothetical protein
MLSRAGLVAAALLSAGAQGAEPCPDFTAGQKRVFWGDLHVHTSYSLDAYGFGTRVDPAAAYAFARGTPTLLADNSTSVSLERPLDFAAVTDHAEYFGIMNACTYPQFSQLEYCQTFRLVSDIVNVTPRSYAAEFAAPIAQSPPSYGPLCEAYPEGCSAGAVAEWQLTVGAAEEAYERCEFTTFNGFEWTGSGENRHLHRNVIFSSDQVPGAALDYVRFPSPRQLWGGLSAQCRPEAGCDVITIPHNTNLSGGEAFAVGNSSPESRALRARYKHLVEIFQSKGNSECLPETQADSSPDCRFELKNVPSDPVPESRWNKARQGYVRSGLGRGLADFVASGEARVNPLKLGIIASTDTHNGLPGAVDEDNPVGNYGWLELGPARRLGKSVYSAGREYVDYNPGGLVAVWAEENTRESIFAALKRRETYGTSGPRILARLYQTSTAGDPCIGGAQMDAVMGGDLAPVAGPPRFVVDAAMDKVPLERIDLVRISYEAGGVQETVIPMNAAEPGGEPTLCRVYEDTAFDPAVPTLWYARILETETPRWSKRDCEQLGLCTEQPMPGGTEAIEGTNIMIQERAWTSPIWHLP